MKYNIIEILNKKLSEVDLRKIINVKIYKIINSLDDSDIDFFIRK